MDLFDTGSYYSSRIPVRAKSSPLIKASICALSAKHMSRLLPAQRDIQDSWLPKVASISDKRTINWSFYSTKYYHQAIVHLRAAVRNDEDDVDALSSVADRESVFAAVAVLSMYELMDKPGTAWRAHLSALPLFGTHEPKHLASSEPPALLKPSATICRPVFWSLARQDFLCTCKALTCPLPHSQYRNNGSFLSSKPSLTLQTVIGQTPTRLNLNDTHLWQSAGLEFGVEDGGPYSSSECLSGPVVMGSATSDEEDQKANEMIWLLSKIANHLIKGDALVPSDYARSAEERSPVGVTQEQLFVQWSVLERRLRDWYALLPSSFEPSARTRFTRPSISPARDDDDNHLVDLEQIWHDLPICAATMQSYHMACILVLVNRPQESTAIRSSVTARLRGYKYALEQSHHHAREICGISLANPPDAVRLHSLEPLYVAGQVLRSHSERRVVMELFQNIQRDIGWSTSHHMIKLQHEWQEGGDWILQT